MCARQSLRLRRTKLRVAAQGRRRRGDRCGGGTASGGSPPSAFPLSGLCGRIWGRCRLRFTLKSAHSDWITPSHREARMRRHARFLVVALVWAGLAPVATRGIAGESPAPDRNGQDASKDRDEFTQVGVTVLARYCANCPGPDRPKAGLNLETLRDDGTFRSRRRAWLRIREYIEGGLMPPEEVAQPSRAEVDRAIGSIKAMMARDDCG